MEKRVKKLRRETKHFNKWNQDIKWRNRQTKEKSYEGLEGRIGRVERKKGNEQKEWLQETEKNDERIVRWESR